MKLMQSILPFHGKSLPLSHQNIPFLRMRSILSNLFKRTSPTDAASAEVLPSRLEAFQQDGLTLEEMNKIHGSSEIQKMFPQFKKKLNDTFSGPIPQ